MPTWTIDQWPFREQPDDLLAELYQARGPLHAEATPDDPRPPLADEVAQVRHLPAPEDGFALVARDPAGEVAGICWCVWQQLNGWDHVLMAEISVLPRWRRQGLGRVLLDRVTGIAEHRGLRLVMGRTRDSVPAGAQFCRRFGAEAAMVNRENRQDLRAVDQAMVDRWLAEGPVRAPGYRLEFVAGRTPPELAGRVAGVFNVMNTAPREDLDVSDMHVTPDLVREYEDAVLATGDEIWAYYAVEEATGRFVGLTNLTIRRGTPDRVQVGDTGVEPAHRGHALGKLLKAAMTRRILGELPEVRWVITSNAGSNAAMLSINDQLGFRTAAVFTTWQIATDRLRSQLAPVPGAALSG